MFTVHFFLEISIAFVLKLYSLNVIKKSRIESNRALANRIESGHLNRYPALGGTVHVFVPNRHGTGISVRCMRPYDEYRQFTPNPEGGARSHQQKNSECQRWHRGGRADVWLTVFYFDKVPTGCQVSNAGTDVFCVCVCVCVCVLRRDHFNCFLIPAESTLNTYCLINNHCIKVCFYLCTLTMNTKQFYIYNM